MADKGRIKLNNRVIDGCKPKAAPYDVTDADTPQLVLRVTPAGHKSFFVRYRRKDGKQTRVKLGNVSTDAAIMGADVLLPGEDNPNATPTLTVTQARSKAREILLSVEKGIDPAAKKRERREQEGPMTLRRFLDGPYASFVRTNLRSAENTLDRLAAAFDDQKNDKGEISHSGFLDRPLVDITAEAVNRWKAYRVSQALKDAGIKPKTAKSEDMEPFRAVGDRHIACLRSALSYAVVCGYLPTNPLKGERGVKLQKVDPRKHIRPFTADEQTKLFKAVDAREERMRRDLAEWNAKRRESGTPELPEFGHFTDYVKPLLTLLFATGMRRGEALKLQWRDVNLDGATVTVRMENAKTKRERTIPLTRTAVEALRLWKAQCAAPFPESPVFTSNRHGGALGDIKKVWGKLLKDGGLPHLRVHDVRHTVATEALKRKDIAVVQKVLGHAQITTTARYLHPDEGQMREALEAMEDRRGNVVAFAQPAEAAE